MPHRQILAAIAALAVAGCSSLPRPPVPVVQHVDLDRFMGDWYVIASIPTYIERDAWNAIESYKLDPDGTIATTFTFNEGGYDGPERLYTPRGFVVDRTSNAVWGMQFARFKAEPGNRGRVMAQGVWRVFAPSELLRRVLRLVGALAGRPGGGRMVDRGVAAADERPAAEGLRCHAAREGHRRAPPCVPRVRRTNERVLSVAAARMSRLAGLAASVAGWFDSHAPARGVPGDPERIDWLRVAAVHRAARRRASRCSGSASAPRRCRGGGAVRAAHVRDHRVLPPLLLASRVPHAAAPRSSCSRCSAPRRRSAARSGGRRTIATITCTRTAGRRHSPLRHGFLWSHMGWFWRARTSPRATRLVRDSRALSRAALPRPLRRRWCRCLLSRAAGAGALAESVAPGLGTSGAAAARVGLLRVDGGAVTTRRSASTRWRTATARAAMRRATHRATTSGWRCSRSARAGTTTTTTIRRRRARASSGGRSTSPTTACELLAALGLVLATCAGCRAAERAPRRGGAAA